MTLFICNVSYLKSVDVFLKIFFVVHDGWRWASHEDFSNVFFQTFYVGHDFGQGLSQLKPLGDQMHNVLPLPQQTLERSLSLLQDDGPVLFGVVFKKLEDAVNIFAAYVFQVILQENTWKGVLMTDF